MAVKQTINLIFALGCILTLGCENAPSQVLESTTTDIPEQGGIAKSADGLFSIRLDPEDLAAAAQVDILTEQGVAPAGVLSRLYRVSISELALRTNSTVRLEYDGSVIEGTDQLAIARIINGGSPIKLSSDWDEETRHVRSNSGLFAADVFAVMLADLPPEEPEEPTGEPEGWDAAPASGPAFVINQLTVADRDSGFDFDGQCGTTTCVDNLLSGLGQHGNDQLSQGVLAGEMLYLIELAGLDAPYFGEDLVVTAKLYRAQDADDPFYPANNFEVPTGHTSCCEFKIDPSSLSGLPPQAHNRFPGRVERGTFISPNSGPIHLSYPVGVPPHPELRLERAQISMRVPGILDELTEGLLGGAISINQLAQTENPYCRDLSDLCLLQFADSSTMLDLVSMNYGPPDIDLDGDGAETIIDTDGDHRIDLCCDAMPPDWGGLFDSCPLGSTTIPPILASDPSSCALDPRMADGFSIAFTFTAVRARIVGVGQ
jgi:hypothetical protein